MKKIVGLIGLLMMVIQPLFTQTVFWEEDFYDSIPGWTLQNFWTHSPGFLNFNGSATPYYFDYSALKILKCGNLMRMTGLPK